MKKIIYLFTIIIFFSTPQNIFAKKNPKNIIIMVCDGWGYNQIAVSKYYHGIDFLEYENFPVQYPMSTYPGLLRFISDTVHSINWDVGYNSHKAWADWKYIKTENDGGRGATGSAEAATAMSTGYKTYECSIGKDMKANDIEHISERAVDIGKSAGVISTVFFAHATPAGFATHHIHRNEYGCIARNMLLNSKLSVIMGCGHPFYDNQGKKQVKAITYNLVEDSLTWNNIINNDTLYSLKSDYNDSIVQDIDNDGIADPWTVLTEKDDFVKYIQGETPKRVLGIPQVHSTLQQKRFDEKDEKPFTVPFIKNVPNLSEMTLTALNVLDNNPEGFFLMIEGGAIDWAGHANSIGQVIEEMTDFNNAVDTVIQWIEKNGGWDQNLLIVTGDHETGYLVKKDFDTNYMKSMNITPQGLLNNYNIVNKGKGNVPDIKWMSSDTTKIYYSIGEHTNQLIPLFAKGEGSDLFRNYASRSDFVRGRYIDNTDIARICFNLWQKGD